jgi:putative ABC transport system ATP-binding protein
MFNMLNSKQVVVSVQYLNHFFGQDALQRQVLFDINLEVCAGEVVIMTGPSGSGKTTLLSLIGGLRSVQAGSLEVVGQELYGASHDVVTQNRRRIGYIFQGHNLLECLTARQNVQMPLEMHPDIPDADAQSKAEAMLELVHLEHLFGSYPNQLSGGEKQRVAIARALISHPQLVLADEPTAALDSKTGRDIVELLQQLSRKQGCAILMVTHDNRILDVADRRIYMEDGKLLQEVVNR